MLKYPQWYTPGNLLAWLVAQLRVAAAHMVIDRDFCVGGVAQFGDL